jgi:hypothetical protein
MKKHVLRMEKPILNMEDFTMEQNDPLPSLSEKRL